ncbi:uncharacterized protein [Cicer arietinum]|uniref:Uncharacterized protein LOC101496217 n=1 Tax=Cicer arietinum TaxID=3827 RepID=A0A1S2Y4J6_CICAR|nr:uncharacterized protein LOC101496217 [Cicer arietinum]
MIQNQKKMKQRITSFCSSEWLEDEIEIAQVLRNLYRISLLTSIPYSWRCKRKRSAIQNTHSSSPLENHRPVNNAAAAAGVVPPSTGVMKAEASSPATPLSFPATESDDKPKHSKKIKTSLKKKRESSLKIIEDLTKTKASLNQEIENVKQHYDQLKSFNLKLKLRKQELLCGNDPKSESKNPNLEIGQKVQLDQSNGSDSINPLEIGQKVQLDQSNGSDSINPSKSTAENKEQKIHQHQHQQMQMQMQMAPNHPTYMPSQTRDGKGVVQFHYPSSSKQTTSLLVASSSTIGLGRNIKSNNNGPLALPDLNLPMDEVIHVAPCQPLDEAITNRAFAAAQARRRRLQIFRQKKH